MSACRASSGSRRPPLRRVDYLSPSAAFNCGSVPEIVSPGVSGFLVRNTKEAVTAVKRIGEIDRLECRRHFELNFSDERMARDYLRIYKQLIHPTSNSIAVKEGVLNWMEVESQTPSTT